MRCKKSIHVSFLLGFLRKIKLLKYPGIFINDDTITTTTNITTNITPATTTTTTTNSANITTSSSSNSSRTDTLRNHIV